MPSGPQSAAIEQKVAEYDNQAIVYVPESYDAAVPHGVVLHLAADGSYDADKLVALYQPLCDAHDLILLAPQTVAPAAAARRRWDPIRDAAYIGKLLEQLGETYKIDRTRVAVHGYQGGGAMGFLLGARQSRLDPRRGGDRFASHTAAAGERADAPAGVLPGILQARDYRGHAGDGR